MPKLLLCWAMGITLMVSSPAVAGEHDSDIQNPADDSGFQPVDLNTVETVDGKALTVIAYGIIFGVFILYALSILRRERAVEKNARRLREHLHQRK